jgi:predicted nucleic acid-binding protein
MRAVVDSNILARAVIKTQDSVGPVLQRLRRREYIPLLSRATLDEFVGIIPASTTQRPRPNRDNASIRIDT